MPAIDFPDDGRKLADPTGRVWAVRGGPWVELVAPGGGNKVVRLSEVAAWGEPPSFAEQVQILEAEKSALAAERDQLAADKAKLSAENAALVAEVDVLRPVVEAPIGEVI